MKATAGVQAGTGPCRGGSDRWLDFNIVKLVLMDVRCDRIKMAKGNAQVRPKWQGGQNDTPASTGPASGCSELLLHINVGAAPPGPWAPLRGQLRRRMLMGQAAALFTALGFGSWSFLLTPKWGKREPRGARVYAGCPPVCPLRDGAAAALPSTCPACCSAPGVRGLKCREATAGHRSQSACWVPR